MRVTHREEGTRQWRGMGLFLSNAGFLGYGKIKSSEEPEIL